MFKEIPLSQKTEKRGSKRSKIYGVGINDAPYQTTIKINGLSYVCPYFSRWKYMLSRCYSKHWLKAHPTYENCYVVPEWYSFMEFKSWMQKQDWKNKQLDKDLLSLGEKRYSPDTCIFVSGAVNSLFNERGNISGDMPLGIYLRNGRYEVGISKGNATRSWVGSYPTVSEAIDAYICAKQKVAFTLADQERDIVVKNAILNYSQYFTDKLLLLKTVF